jgi:nicotinamide-nucleotide amidase
VSTPEQLANLVVTALSERAQTLATAESLTGGLIGAAITAVPGASAAYLGGVVAYATPLKHRLAGVPEEVLSVSGPVSPQTAIALAVGVRMATGADWVVAATGVAGPDPQDGHGPGEVWLGLAGPEAPASAQRYRFGGDRRAIREASVLAALHLLAAALNVE